MRLYPKVIPFISRECIQQLMQDGDIEVEPMRVADAEMDMSAIMREYLANEERVNQATREALERRGYDYSKFNQVKREMADVRGFKMGDEGIEYVINQMIEFLLISRNVEEVYAADNILRQGYGQGYFPDWLMNTSTDVAQVRFMLVGLGLMLLMIFRPQGIFGNRRELELDAR